MSTAIGRQRAAQAVAARRGDLGMTQQELAARADVDVKTVGSLEKRGRWPIARSRAGIERALGWPPGEMERIASGEPEEPGLPTPAELERLRQHVREVLSPERAAAVEALLDAVMRGDPSPRQKAGDGGGSAAPLGRRRSATAP